MILSNGKLKKAAVFGHFGGNEICYGGQTAKTRTVTAAMEEKIGQGQITKLDTYGGMKSFVKLFFKLPFVLAAHSNFIMMPARNGVRLLSPLLLFWNSIFRRRLHYVVIGGWLPQFLEERPRLKRMLQKFHGVYVETFFMKRSLEEAGFTNVIVMPNCKDIHVLTPEELVYSSDKPLRLCTFSRVMQQKGIEDAVLAVKAVNEKMGQTVYVLDIYGQVDPNEEQWFAQLQQRFPEYIVYRGMVSFDQSVEILKSYFALLFPTYYDGEGFAGTLIDALASGIPAIASDFRYNPEIVAEGKTGRLHTAKDPKALEKVLEEACEDVAAWNGMKLHCIEHAKKYTPASVVQILLDQFGT